MLVYYLYFFLIQKIILISFFGLMINQQHLVFLLCDLCDAWGKECVASSA